MSKARGLADLGNVYSDGALSNRNLIINGAMTVAQRGTVGTHPAAGTGIYPSVDRWKFNVDSGGSPLSVDQSTDAPNGFSKSLYLSPDTTATMTGSRRVIFEQSIEGQNLASWGYGTVDAKPLTLSFWVKSNLTGDVTASLKTAEYCGQTYSIDVADTWEYKTVTFPANAAGTPLTYDNTAGAVVQMYISVSSIFTGTYAGDGVWTAISNASSTAGTGFNLYSDIANYINITGVQLEVGDTATPFEHRSYGQELALCQRYYYQDTTASHFVRSFSCVSLGNLYEDYPLPTIMRTTPSVSVVLGTDVNKVSSVSILGRTTKSGYLIFQKSATGDGYSSVNKVTADAEL